MKRISSAGFPDEMVYSIHFINPGAAMPMIVAHETEQSWSLKVEGNILVVGQLIEKMAGICSFVSTTAIVGAAQVSSHAQAENGPLIPIAISIEANRNGSGATTAGMKNCEQEE